MKTAKFINRETSGKIFNDVFVKYLIVTLFFISAGIIIFANYPNISKFQYSYEKGSPWKYEEITAPYAFEIQKSKEEIQKEEIILLKDFAPIYNRINSIEEESLQRLKNKNGNTDEATYPYYRYIDRKLKEIYKAGIIASNDLERELQEEISKIRVVTDNVSKEITLSSFYTTKNAYEKIINEAPSDLDHDILRDYNINNYINENIFPDKEKTESLKKELLKTISLTKGQIQSGEKIIDHGEIITEQAFDILNSYKNVVEENSKKKDSHLIALGQGIIIASSLLVFFLYFYLFRIQFLEKKRDSAFMLSMIVIFCTITSWAVKHEISPYLIPYAITPIIVTTFFDTRTALFTHLTTVLLCSFIVPNEFEFLFLQVIIGMISICTLKTIYQRSHLIRSAALIVFSYLALYIGFALVHERGIEQIDLHPIQFFIINGLLLLFAYPFIYIVEKVFGYTSDASLVELANTNNELLRKFSELAPGSFQHSMQVSNLATEAALAIDANPMLVRTGALYHDIGKMKQPEYFTENQASGEENLHQKLGLTEIQSAKIIINHVKDGLEIADEYGLPEKIKDFIRTHHGKSKAKFFYNNYVNKHPDEEVDENAFIYPGPTPNSRETIILMICDAVEAASRSMKNYNDKSINDLVENIVNAQMQDGLFNDAPIEIKQITTIKNVLKEKLKTIYHTRISYPELKNK